MSVLILEAEQKQALAITQSLGARGISVTCVSCNPSAPSFYSKYCKERFISPLSKNEDSYLDFLLDIVRKKKYELLIQCSDMSTECISREREKLSPFIKFLLPSHDTVMLSLHKDRLMKFCHEKNILTPETYFPQEKEDVINLNGNLNYPLVLKGTRGASASNVRYAKSKYDLLYNYIELKERAPEVIIQKYIRGENRNFYAVCKEGELIAFFMFRVLRSYPTTGGTPAKAISFFDEDLKNIAKKVVRELNWTGFLNIDFIKDDKDGQYKLLEINPRFGGTISLPRACGLDFPFIVYKQPLITRLKL